MNKTDSQKQEKKIEKNNALKNSVLTDSLIDVQAIYRAVDSIGDELLKIKDENRYSLMNMVDILCRHFPEERCPFSKETISRIINHDRKRLPNAEHLFALARAFNISLDAIAHGNKQPEPLFPAELLRQMYDSVALKVNREKGN